MSGRNKRIDREKTCPLLLKMFCCINGHHHLDEYGQDRHPSTEDELVVYTWRDASLSELAGLVKDVFEDARKLGVKLSFRLIFQSSTGRWSSRDLGTVINGRTGREDYKTLEELGFVTGDYIDVSICTGYEGGAPSMASAIGRSDRHHQYNQRRHYSSTQHHLR